MILLEFHNRVIQETLKSRLRSLTSGDGKVKPVDVTVADFDGCLYHISNGESTETPSTIFVSISLQYYHELQAHGVDDYLKGIYGDKFVAPESGYNATVQIDLPALGESADSVIDEVSKLKRHCFAAVFDKYFALQQSGGDGADGHPAIISYRPEESMYISAHHDRVTVVFSTVFTDEDDVVIGKVFLQEFKEGRKGNQSAPHVLFSHKDPPRELGSVPNAVTGDNVGYITFVLFPRHVDSKHSAHTVDLIHQFRDYLHYHLKCSKAYLHTRMRARTASLLQVLNRAKPEAEVKTRKTISGRSFMRK
eukprot:m.166544 g.166544  ORF g.166544 m.166544 type:complete len:307 (-) comp12701_c0_seq1:155-1075(-)